MNFFLVFLLNLIYVFINNGENDVDLGFDDDGLFNEVSWVKCLEFVNMMFLFVWWVVGFYWIIVGG